MTNDFKARLSQVVRDSIRPEGDVGSIRRLSGGASQETWQISLKAKGATEELILRRAQNGTLDSRAHGPGLAGEAELMRAAAVQGVPVPRVLHVLEPQDGLGTGFLMPKVEGETIARKILRDDRFSAVRPRLAERCGEILAAIHNIDLDHCPPLWQGGGEAQLRSLRQQYAAQEQPRPVFEVAFRWLFDNLPTPVAQPRVVHGDFRNGNLIIDEQDIRAVLDWELAHLGDPVEDLGWLCVPSWRFGEVDKAAGGFGTIEDLIAGYERAGGASVNDRRLQFWMVFGTLFWGVTCVEFALDFLRGDRSVERAAIGRRMSETEIDLLMLIDGGARL